MSLTRIHLALLLIVGCSTGPRILHRTKRQALDETAARVAVAGDGTLEILLPRCVTIVSTVYSSSPGLRPDIERTPCSAGLADVVITAPWGKRYTAPLVVTDPTQAPLVRLPPDRSEGSIDPLDARTWPTGAPWKMEHALLTEPLVWIPTEAELALIARAMSGPDQIDGSHERSSRPPELVVDALRAGNDELLAGGTTTLELAVTNRGDGPAYRVTASIRSSVPHLHGRQFSLGKLEPGKTLQRRIRVELPSSVDDDSAMVVLVFNEANGYPPPDFSRRFPIRVVATAPQLALTCATESGSTEVDAGQIVRLRCVVRNDGGVRAEGVITAATVGGASAVSPPIEITARGAAMVDLPVRIPTSAGIDQQLQIEIATTERSTRRRARTQLVVTVRRPRVCPDGRLTRTAYRQKREQLARARAAGDLTDAEFDRYDAELVSCLAD